MATKDYYSGFRDGFKDGAAYGATVTGKQQPAPAAEQPTVKVDTNPYVPSNYYWNARLHAWVTKDAYHDVAEAVVTQHCIDERMRRAAPPGWHWDARTHQYVPIVFPKPEPKKESAMYVVLLENGQTAQAVCDRSYKPKFHGNLSAAVEYAKEVYTKNPGFRDKLLIAGVHHVVQPEPVKVETTTLTVDEEQKYVSGLFDPSKSL